MDYAGWIAFDATDGSRFWVSVLMRVGQVAVGEVGWAAALMLDQWTISKVRQWVGTDNSGSMDVQFDDMPPGKYYLLIGTDNNNDSEICDEGELCQIYPTNSRPSPLEIVDRNIALGSFIVGFRGQGGVGGASTATGDEGARLLNFGLSGRYEKH